VTGGDAAAWISQASGLVLPSAAQLSHRRNAKSPWDLGRITPEEGKDKAWEV